MERNPNIQRRRTKKVEEWYRYLFSSMIVGFSGFFIAFLYILVCSNACRNFRKASGLYNTDFLDVNKASCSLGVNNATSSLSVNNTTSSLSVNNTNSSLSVNNTSSSLGVNSATSSFGVNSATSSFGVNNTASTLGVNYTTFSLGVNNATSSFGVNNKSSRIINTTSIALNNTTSLNISRNNSPSGVGTTPIHKTQTRNPPQAPSDEGEDLVCPLARAYNMFVVVYIFGNTFVFLWRFCLEDTYRKRRDLHLSANTPTQQNTELAEQETNHLETNNTDTKTDEPSSPLTGVIAA